MQRLLNIYLWDAGRVGGALARYVVRALGDPPGCWWPTRRDSSKGPDVGRRAERQYTGTAGRVENDRGGAAPRGGASGQSHSMIRSKNWRTVRIRCRCVSAVIVLPADLGWPASHTL